MKRLFRLVGLGVLIWGLGLIWPQVNQVLTAPIMGGLAVLLGLAVLASLLAQYLKRDDHGDGTGRRRSSRVSAQEFDSVSASQ